MADLALAVDIGGTKIAAGLVHPDGTVVAEITVATPQGGARETWLGLAAPLLSLAEGRAVAGIGVGSAGPTDPVAGTVSPVNIPGWRDFPLVERICELVPGVPVRLAGDGICAAAGEHWLGAGRGHDDLLVTVVSTGVGGGLLQAGRLVHGPTGNAGHIGHVIVDFDGEACPCGGHGCVEAYASGPSMVRWASSQGWRGGTAADLAESARQGDPTAHQAFQRAGRALAAGIVTTGALCDLSRAVIGGGVARAADLLLPPIRSGLASHAKLGFLRRISVTTAELGSRAGLLGAAALIHNPDRYR